MKASQALSDLDDTLGAAVDHVISTELRTNEEHTMCHEMLSNPIAGITSVIEDTVVILVATEGQNGISKKDTWLESLLQDLNNKVFDEKLRSVQFKNHILPKFWGAHIISPERGEDDGGQVQ